MSEQPKQILGIPMFIVVYISYAVSVTIFLSTFGVNRGGAPSMKDGLQKTRAS